MKCGMQRFLLLSATTVDISRTRVGPRGLMTAFGMVMLEEALQSRHPELDAILLISGQCKATDPRDKIYALLEFSEGQNLEVDYHLPVTEVYRKTARYLLLTDRDYKYSFFMLHMIGISFDEPMTGLPSWVPDWSSQRSITQIVTRCHRAAYDATPSFALFRRSTHSFDRSHHHRQHRNP